MAESLWGEEEVRKAERGTRNREGLIFGGPTKECSGLWTCSPLRGLSSDGSRFWFVAGEDFTRLGRVLLRPSLPSQRPRLGQGSVVLLAGKHIQGVTWRDEWNTSLPAGVEAVCMEGSESSAAEVHPAAKATEDEGEGEEEEVEEQEGEEGVEFVSAMEVVDQGGGGGELALLTQLSPEMARQLLPPKKPPKPKQPPQQRGEFQLGRVRPQPPTQQPPTPPPPRLATPPPRLATPQRLATANTANNCPGLSQFVASLQLYHGGEERVERANQDLSRRCHALHDPNPNPP